MHDGNYYLKAYSQTSTIEFERYIELRRIDKYDEYVLVGRNSERLNETKNALLEKKNTLNIKVVSLDLTKDENCINLYNDNKDVDLLINDAGFGDFGYFDETDSYIMEVSTASKTLHQVNFPSIIF